MDRKNFLKKSILVGLAGSVLPSIASANNSAKEKSTYDKMMGQVGFNPNYAIAFYYEVQLLQYQVRPIILMLTVMVTTLAR